MKVLEVSKAPANFAALPEGLARRLRDLEIVVHLSEVVGGRACELELERFARRLGQACPAATGLGHETCHWLPTRGSDRPGKV